ncbi:MAG: hypothetical protein KJO07_04710, partial [Deltaproteobacteria bacterium]|nr:hypothetical protein [Deltaproteobacteria bacterium]
MTYLGIDVGTQSLKVMVTDSRLRILAIASESYPTRYPRPGWAEQDPRDWERAASRAVPRALAGAGIDAAAVAAVGIAGQLDGCVAVDASGEPVAPCLIWMDRRAVDFVPELPSDFVERTGLVADPGHMAAKIAWLARGNPGARYHQPVSYLVERMTGEACFDPALASTTMLFELGSSTPSQELCALFEIDPQTLPRVVPADQQAGQVSAAGAKRFGLVVGTPVATGTGDDFATPLG